MARELKPFAAPILAALALLAGCASDSLYEQHHDAVLAYESGANARAEALYQGLARSAPNDPETWLRLGNLYARAERPDAAADAYHRGLLLAPSDARLWYNLGIVRQRQAHAALIQAHQFMADDDPLLARSQAIIDRLAPAEGDAPTPAQR